MRVAMYHNNQSIPIQEQETPKINPDELLVKIWASGICGSDVLEWYRVPKAPLVLGHEIAGEIVEVGSAVQGCRLGLRVFVSHHVPCNMCDYCLAGHESVCGTLAATNFDPGGFCEYVRVPAINVRNGVFALPDEMTYEEAVFIEPLACVYRGQEHAGWMPGRHVAVVGAGITGLMHVQLAKATGASKIFAVDLNPSRLEAAKRFGADEVFQAGPDVPALLKEKNEGKAAELVIIATGALPALKQAFSLVDKGGIILFFAPSDPGAELSMPFNDLWRREVTMTSTYAGSPRDIRKAMELISSGRINVKDMITHRLPISEIEHGFELVQKAQDSMKVIILPQD